MWKRGAKGGTNACDGVWRSVAIVISSLAVIALTSACAALDAGVSLGGRDGAVRVGVRGGQVSIGTDWNLPGRRSIGRGREGAARTGLLTKPVAAGRLTSRFGARRGQRLHAGVDYAAPAGTAVYAAGAGTVDKLYTSASYGNYVRIRHADGLHTAYAHLQRFAPGLRVGSAVARGQTIGAVGSSGRASGPHLHYEVLRAGKAVDPLGG